MGLAIAALVALQEVDVRDATVRVGPLTAWQTAGVVVARRDDVAYVVSGCARELRNSNAAEVDVVFAANVRRRARVVRCERGVAILAVDGAKGLPAPLELNLREPIEESQAVTLAGFAAKDLIERKPEAAPVTLSTKVKRTETVRTEDAEVLRLECEDDLHGGLAGGALVDAKGRIRAIALTIGPAKFVTVLPSSQLRGLLEPHIGACHFDAGAIGRDAATYAVSVTIVDPLGLVQECALVWCPESAAPAPAPGPGGRWERLVEGARAVPLKLVGETGRATLDVARPAGAPAATSFWVQVECGRDGGKPLRSDPRPLDVRFKDDAPGLSIADDLKTVGVLRTKAVISALFLGRDGYIYALDLTDGRMLRIDPDSLKIVSEVEVVENAFDAVLSSDGAHLYVVARRPDDAGPGKPGSTIQTIRADGLTPAGTLTLPVTIRRALSAHDGRLWALVGERGLCAIDVAKRTVDDVFGAGEAWAIEVRPDLGRVYRGWGSGGYNRYPLPRPVGRVEDSRPDATTRSGGAAFRITPGGAFLIAYRDGHIFRLSAYAGADLRVVAPCERGVAATAESDALFVVSTDQGFLKFHDLSRLELVKSLKTEGTLTRIVLDEKRRRVYGFRPAAPGLSSVNDLKAGDIVSLSYARE